MAASRSTVVFTFNDCLDSANPAIFVMEPCLLPKRDTELDREFALELVLDDAGRVRLGNCVVFSSLSFSFAGQETSNGSVFTDESSESLMCCRPLVLRSAHGGVDKTGESVFGGRLGELVFVLGFERRFWGLL